MERPSSAVRDEPHQNSWLHAEGSVSRLLRSTLGNLLGLKGLWPAGFLSRLGRWRGRRGLPSPIPRVGLAPLPHAFHRRRAAEGGEVGGFVQPTTLAGGLTGLAAWRWGTGGLAANAAGVRVKEGLTMLTLALSEVPDHWPASPQVNDRQGSAWKEEQHEDKAGEKKRKKREAMREMAFAGRTRTGATLHFQPARLTAVSGHR